MPDEYYFDEQGMRRSVRSIRWTERQPINNPPTPGLFYTQSSPQTIVPAVNKSGETIPAYSCVEVYEGDVLSGGVVYHNYVRKPSTTYGKLYATTAGVDSIVTSDDPEPRTGVIFETGLVRYDSGNPSFGDGYGPKPGQFTVAYGFPGFICLGVVDAPNKIMRVMPYLTRMIVKMTADVTANSSTTAYKIMVGTPGSESDSGFTTVLSAYTRTALSDTKFAFLTFINGNWYLEPAECG